MTNSIHWPTGGQYTLANTIIGHFTLANNRLARIIQHLSQEVIGHLPLESKLHRGGAFDEQLSRAHDERSIRVSNACGELSERTSVARVRVRAEQHLQVVIGGGGESINKLHGHLGHDMTCD